MSMRLPALALKYHHFALVLLVLVSVLGTLSLLTMPRAEDPQFDFATVGISVVHPGSTPEDLERMVVFPLEEAIRGLEDVDEVIAWVRNGGATVEVRFLYGSDPDEKLERVEAAVGGVRDQLPPDLLHLDIEKYSPTNVTMFMAAVMSDDRTYDDLRLTAEHLQKRFERLGGVKKVEVWGHPQNEVQVRLHPQRAAAHGVDVPAVERAVAGAARTVPGGHVDAGDVRFSVVTSGRYRSLDDIRKTVMRADSGHLVALGDIADVVLGDATPSYLTRHNGQRAVLVAVQQQLGTNVLPLSAQLSATLDRFAEEHPEYRFTPVFDQAAGVAERIDGFFTNLLQGLALVGAIVLLTLGFRAACVVLLTIPLSMLTGVLFLDWSGYGLQQMSIVGLVIALGLLVDNAIVVTENIARHLRQGDSKTAAAVKGASQVGWAVTAGTFTTVLAFVPMILLQSDTGSFIRSMPVAVVVTLIASLWVALTVTPQFGRMLLQEKPIATAAPGAGSSTRYTRALQWALGHRFLVLVVAGLVFVCSLTLFPRVGFSLFPKAEKAQFMVNVDLPVNANLDATHAVALHVEDRLRGYPEVEAVTTHIGRGSPAVYYNVHPSSDAANFAQLFVQHRVEGLAARNEFVARVRQDLSAVVGAKVRVHEFSQGPGSEAPIALRLIGEELDVLESVAAEVAARMANVSGVVNVDNPLAERAVELRSVVNREKAELAGLAPWQLDQVVRAQLAGLQVATYHDLAGEDYPVVIYYGHPGLTQVSQLDAALVQTPSGTALPLRHLVNWNLEMAPAAFQRRDRSRTVVVTADIEAGYQTAAVTDAVLDAIDLSAFPAGVRLQLGGEHEERSESFGGMLQSLAAAVLGIFAVLVLQFRSFIQPLVVFVAVPFAVTGALVGLFVTGNSFSFTAFVGLTSLVGIVVNNSIILVDYANNALEAGRTPVEAAVSAAQVRLRPILLTTVTTIGGLLPLTLSGSSMWAPMGWAIIGGLLFSTVLTLFIVPVLYSLFSSRRADPVAGLEADSVAADFP